MGGGMCCQNELIHGEFQVHCLEMAETDYKPYLVNITKQINSADKQLKTQHKQYIAGSWQNDEKKTGKGVIFQTDKFYYEGDVVNGKAKGDGRIIWPNKAGYRGKIDNNRANGKGILQFGEKSTKLVGPWKDGYPKLNETFQMNKFGSRPDRITFVQESRKKTEAEYFKGPITVVIQYSNGVVYQGELKHKEFAYKIEGKGTLKFVDGSYYSGDFIEGKMHGQGRYYWADTGNMYEGQYKNNVRDGKGKYYFKQNEFAEGQWKNGIYEKQDQKQTIATTPKIQSVVAGKH